MIAWIRRFLLLLVGVTLPLQAVAVQIAGIHMTAFKAATAVLLVLGALHFAVGGRPTRDPKLPWIAFFAVTYLLSSVQGFLRGVPISELVPVGVTQYAILLYYALIGFVILSRVDLVVLLSGQVIGSVVTSLPVVLGTQQATPVFERYEGLSGQANLLGLEMTIALPVAIALFIVSRSFVARAALVVAGVIAGGGLLFSLSRTAFVAALSMWGFWIYRTGRLDTIRYGVLAIPVLIMVLLMAPTSVVDRFNTLIDPQERATDQSIQGRFTNLEWGLKAFASNPIIGVGRLSYQAWAWSQPGGREVHSKMHSGHLRIALEQGIVGLIPYVMILLLSWRQYTRAWRMARSRDFRGDPLLSQLGTYALLLQVALFGILVEGLASMIVVKKSVWLVLALSPVVQRLVVQRVEELRDQQETVEETHGAETPLLSPLPGSSRA